MFNFNNKKLFKSFNMTILLIDGKVIETDPIKFKTFKKMVDNRIKGEEIRDAVEEDYLIEFNELQYLCDNVEDAEYISFQINKKDVTLKPDDIVSIVLNVKK